MALRHSRWAVGWLIAFVSACGGENTLGGSVDALFPLSASRVEILRSAEAIQVSYLTNRGVDVDLVLRLTVALEGVSLESGKAIPLDGEVVPGHWRATFVHLAAGEPPRLLPPVRRGDLTISEGGDPNENTRGDFSVSFATEPDDAYGAGRNVHGSFAGVAGDARVNPCAPAGSCIEGG